jgi:hypothetical protein
MSCCHVHHPYDGWPHLLACCPHPLCHVVFHVTVCSNGQELCQGITWCKHIDKINNKCVKI